ncbi:SulP family inorganic anion transporter [Aestuariirhabdus sp. Z084]|uniref:SulP family inorganic anion transporter n=1 Tax=Aestuariirhabdus haliotis TaxID=2918751 RepID=UPI00201B3B8A|nr:SulP family inorganic anion transporter [Aestuariirhabdus haliotis]MCL6416808.1 SulP family inorganic anion transporter [Aestuariirhabdus haliotis]MCL6420808.1 SulP family inorganic anion transporter [Aestuariirhabdus haliotis]
MFDLIARKQPNAKNDILSGVTVALALVPEAVAFAFVAGVAPMVGLYAAFMMGLITSIIGGRPGMISGATGAMAVVMVALVAQHGVQYLFAAVILAGVIQITAGLLKLGKFIRIVPHPVMLGFVNGLAIVIFLAQLGQFQVRGDAGMEWMQGSMLFTMGLLVFITMAIIHLLPKITTAIPSSLAAIVVVTLAVHLLGLDARTVIDFVRDSLPVEEAATATLKGDLPSFAIPMVPLSWEMLYIILPYSCILAAVGLIESLLTMSLIDEITDTRGQGNRECVGQGVANTVNGFFGGMGGCAMIGQSMININSGGRGRLSGITAALVLLCFILFAAKLIEVIPLAALVGVMFMVVLGTFEWSSFRIIRKIPTTDAFILVLVSGVTVFTDLAIAVVVGVIVSALVFAWKHAQHIHVETYIDDKGSKVYELRGPIFFGSVSNFRELFDPRNDPDDVIIEFQRSRVSDHSGIEALDSLADKYLAQGKTLHLRHLSPECRKLLKRAGSLCEVNVMEDPNYRVATDELA